METCLVLVVAQRRWLTSPLSPRPTTHLVSPLGPLFRHLGREKLTADASANVTRASALLLWFIRLYDNVIGIYFLFFRLFVVGCFVFHLRAVATAATLLPESVDTSRLRIRYAQGDIYW